MDPTSAPAHAINMFMPIDNERYRSLASKGNVGGVALDVTIALDAVMAALKKLSERSGVDIADELEEIRRKSASLDARFEDLAGWTSE